MNAWLDEVVYRFGDESGELYGVVNASGDLGKPVVFAKIDSPEDDLYLTETELKFLLKVCQEARKAYVAANSTGKDVKVKTS